MPSDTLPILSPITFRLSVFGLSSAGFFSISLISCFSSLVSLCSLVSFFSSFSTLPSLCSLPSFFSTFSILASLCSLASFFSTFSTFASLCSLISTFSILSSLSLISLISDLNVLLLIATGTQVAMPLAITQNCALPRGTVCGTATLADSTALPVAVPMVEKLVVRQ